MTTKKPTKPQRPDTNRTVKRETNSQRYTFFLTDPYDKDFFDALNIKGITETVRGLMALHPCYETPEDRLRIEQDKSMQAFVARRKEVRQQNQQNQSALSQSANTAQTGSIETPATKTAKTPPKKDTISEELKEAIKAWYKPDTADTKPTDTTYQNTTYQNTTDQNTTDINPVWTNTQIDPTTGEVPQYENQIKLDDIADSYIKYDDRKYYYGFLKETYFDNLEVDSIRDWVDSDEDKPVKDWYRFVHSAFVAYEPDEEKRYQAFCISKTKKR